MQRFFDYIAHFIYPYKAPPTVYFQGIQMLPTRKDNTQKPLARSGHRVFTDDDYLYVIGGYSATQNDEGHIFAEVWRYNFLTEQWSLLVNHNDADFPAALASHAIVQFQPYTPHILLFGGSNIPFGQANAKDAYLISTFQRTVISVKLTPSSPHGNGIYGHAMCRSETENNVAYIVGGTSGSVYNLHVYKLTLCKEENRIECKWERLDDPRMELQGLYRLEITHDEVHNRLLLLGGGSPEFADGFAKLTTFNLGTNRYEIVTTKSDRGRFPAERRSHSLVRHKRYLYIAGGCAPLPNGKLNVRDDVWGLSMDTFEWRKVSKLTVPVYFHDAAVTSEGKMVLWGGVTDGDSKERSDEGQCMWVDVPKLKTLAVQNLTKSYPKLFNSLEEELRISNTGCILKHVQNKLLFVNDICDPAS